MCERLRNDLNAGEEEKCYQIILYKIWENKTRNSVGVLILIGLRALTFDCIVCYSFFIFSVLPFIWLSHDNSPSTFFAHFLSLESFSLYMLIWMDTHAQMTNTWLSTNSPKKFAGSMGYYINLDEKLFWCLFLPFYISVPLIIWGIPQSSSQHITFSKCTSPIRWMVVVLSSQIFWSLASLFFSFVYYFVLFCYRCCCCVFFAR